MANINRDYLVILDVKSGSINAPTMKFMNTDKSTSNIYVQLVVKQTVVVASPIQNATDFTVKANIVKNKNTAKFVEGVLVNEAEAIYEFDLPSDCTDLSGNYLLEFVVSAAVDGTNESITSTSTTYTVGQSILTGLNSSIEDSADYPILQQLIDEVRELQANGGGEPGASSIDDTTASATTTYSSNKIESIKEGLSSQIKNIASKFSTEQTDNLYKIKYEGIIIAEIPIGDTASTLKTFGNLLSRISTWNAMGDSITDETIEPKTKYPTILKNKYTNMTTVNNYGHNGWSIAIPSNSSFGSFLTLIDSMSSSCDLITIAGGVNDFLHSVPIGERSSTLDTEFYGAVNNLITRLRAKYPNTPIIWIIPLPVTDGVYESNDDGTNPIGNTLDDYRKALRNKLDDLQVLAIDLSTDPDMDPGKISTDGLHPTAAGQEIYANKLDNSIPSIPLGEQIINCTNIALNTSTLTFTDTNSQTLVATVTPSNTTDTIVWESSNKDIATVKNGVVVPIAVGECTITATCGDYSATCAVTVSSMSEIISSHLVFKIDSTCMNTADNTLTDNIAGISATLTGNPTVSGNQIAFTVNDTFAFDLNSLSLITKNRTIRVKFTATSLASTLANVITLGTSITDWYTVTGCYVDSNKVILTHGSRDLDNVTVGDPQGACADNRLSTVPVTDREYELVISENIDGNVRWFIDGTLVQNGTTALFNPLCLSNTEGKNRFIGSYSLIEIYNEYCDNYTEFTNMVNN